ncbi:MAG: NADH-quinone oxidoreductase subunit A [Myxococcales bacterium]|nr:NADH-quinone oxidoreductase subunit A [Myxococcales bacterium]MCB9522920.1 NADH-quinone oxidoreductase subunit A [Myxococcales bacterium]
MIDVWAPALVFMALSLAMGVGMVVAARVLAVKSKDTLPTRTVTYESGEEAKGTAWIRFHPRYYVVALVFVLFDVEAVFLLPWTLNVKGLGWFAIAEMVVFLGVLLLGWGYALRKGALRWQ